MAEAELWRKEPQIAAGALGMFRKGLWGRNLRDGGKVDCLEVRKTLERPEQGGPELPRETKGRPV